jgi:AcrR family transcriptional regulator
LTELATMIARKVPRQERSRALVEAIVEAAARILVQQGRDALTTNAVALRAGVSIGSLYQYFPNREAILAAVVSDHRAHVRHCMAQVDLSDAAGLTEIVTRIVAGLFAAHRINPALHLVLANEIAVGKLQGNGADYASAKDDVVALFGSVLPSIRSELRRPDVLLDITVVAEIGHALAHVAIVPANDNAEAALFEREAVRAMLAYLRSAE